MKRNDGRDGRDEERERERERERECKIGSLSYFIGKKSEKKSFFNKLKVARTKRHQKSVMCLDL